MRKYLMTSIPLVILIGLVFIGYRIEHHSIISCSVKQSGADYVTIGSATVDTNQAVMNITGRFNSNESYYQFSNALDRCITSGYDSLTINQSENGYIIRCGSIKLIARQF